MDIIDHLLFHLNLNILIESNRSKCPHHYDHCDVEAQFPEDNPIFLHIVDIV